MTERSKVKAERYKTMTERSKVKAERYKTVAEQGVVIRLCKLPKKAGIFFQNLSLIPLNYNEYNQLFFSQILISIVMENQDKKNEHISWYIFIGCMFVGMGIGAALDQEGAGTMVGMGVGFLASAFIKIKKK